MRPLMLLLILALSGCAVTRLRIVALTSAPRPPVAHVVTCGDIGALAGAIVDGRRAGQSRVEQRRLVDLTGVAAPLHLGLVDSIYDWPRPAFPSGWSVLRAQSVAAASDHCLNRQSAILRGAR